MRADRKKENRCSNACPHDTMKDTKKDARILRVADCRQKAIQAKFAYVNRLRRADFARCPQGGSI